MIPVQFSFQTELHVMLVPGISAISSFLFEDLLLDLHFTLYPPLCLQILVFYPVKKSVTTQSGATGEA
jgi:hypothetical protein